MLRPSRPMMRPFMSSEGRLTTETVVSATWLAAVRWMLSERMLRARRSASRRASSSTWRTSLAMSCRASSSVRLSSSSRACAVLIPETRSKVPTISWRAASTSSVSFSMFASRSRSDWSRRSCSTARASSCSSRWIMRCSAPASSARRSRSSSSTSLRTLWTSSLASSRASLRMVSASRRASRTSRSASRSAVAARLPAKARRMKYPAASPAANATTTYSAVIILRSPHCRRRTKKAGRDARPVLRSHRHAIPRTKMSRRRGHDTHGSVQVQTSQTSLPDPCRRCQSLRR